MVVDALGQRKEEESRVQFVYDDLGCLQIVKYFSFGRPEKTIVISYTDKNMPLESLERLSNGHAEWRIEYRYDNHKVLLKQFYDYGSAGLHFGNQSSGTIVSSFVLNDEGRVVSGKSYKDDLNPELSYDEVYETTWHTDGTRAIHVEQMNSIKQTRCTVNLEESPSGHFLGPNGIEVHNYGLRCAYPEDPGTRYDQEFDTQGNIQGNLISIVREELGRQITYKEFETVSNIEYY